MNVINIHKTRLFWTRASIAEAFLRMTLLLLLLANFYQILKNLIISTILSKLVKNRNLLRALIKINRYSHNIFQNSWKTWTRCLNRYWIHFQACCKINKLFTSSSAWILDLDLDLDLVYFVLAILYFNNYNL